MKLFNLIHNGTKLGEYHLLKSCKLNTGYTVYLFRSDSVAPLCNYVVACRRGDETVEFHKVHQLAHPFSMYLDTICCYA